MIFMGTKKSKIQYLSIWLVIDSGTARNTKFFNDDSKLMQVLETRKHFLRLNEFSYFINILLIKLYQKEIW